MLLGIDYGEINRAKISARDGIENRYPLIEHEIDRDECKKIITDHGLLVPMKSGCYICPFQRIGQWVELRRKHPDLFCKAKKMEDANMEYRKSRGKKAGTLNRSGRRLKAIVRADQLSLFEQDNYPPCECGL